jgi:hypothetical protein
MKRVTYPAVLLFGGHFGVTSKMNDLDTRRNHSLGKSLGYELLQFSSVLFDLTKPWDGLDSADFVELNNHDTGRSFTVDSLSAGSWSDGGLQKC